MAEKSEHCYNPIGFLNEFSQKNKNQPIANYAECTSTILGLFSMKCAFGHREVVRFAPTKKEAKRNAADSMVILLNEENYFDKFKSETTLSDSIVSKVETTKNDPPICSPTSNPISVLNEYCQTNQTEFPVYTEARISGGFVFRCKFKGQETHSYASSKKSAKTKAAFEMCKQLKLRFQGESDLPSEKDDFQVEKNAVIALNEMLALTTLKAVYEIKPSVMNLFVIVCMVGGISGEGRDTTKKGAKISAANQVLQKLSNIKRLAIVGREEEITEDEIDVRLMDKSCCLDAEVSGVVPQLNSSFTNGKTHYLEDFDLNTDEE